MGTISDSRKQNLFINPKHPSWCQAINKLMAGLIIAKNVIAFETLVLMCKLQLSFWSSMIPK